MKVLVTGGSGQLGKAFAKVAEGQHQLLLTDYRANDEQNVQAMDITNRKAVEAVFVEFGPDVLVHCAAYTNVDGAEEDQAGAEAVNAHGTAVLAEACKKFGVGMVYISTDYVFDGTSTRPYRTTDQTNPQSVYGKTKLLGETVARRAPKFWILRTSWLIGDGKNFVRTMLHLAEEMSEVNVVNDQVGRPTFAKDLALAILGFVSLEPDSGVNNVQGDGREVSWAQFAEKIFEIAGTGTKVNGITTEEYLKGQSGRTIAPRPAYSVLDLTKTKSAGIHVADWEESLTEYLS